MAAELVTLMAQIHLHLQGLEVIGEARLGLISHLLASPLLEAAKFLVDIHDCRYGLCGSGGEKITSIAGVGRCG